MAKVIGELLVNNGRSLQEFQRFMISEENLMLYESRDKVIKELIEHCFPNQRETALMLITD